MTLRLLQTAKEKGPTATLARALLVALVLGSSACVTACSSSGADAAGDGSVLDGACGGTVPTTVVDMHCASADGGRGDAVGPHEGTEADDDNCLFHAVMGLGCVRMAEDVAFTLDLTNLGDMMPAAGADPQIIAMMGTHPLPNTNPMTTASGGFYTIDPVHFDQSGRWTVTFHVYDPIPAMHSHVSFFIDVP